jgi:hypothetical protein
MYKQAKKEVKIPVLCRTPIMTLLGISSLVTDAVSTYVVQDLLNPSNKYLAMVIVVGVCIFFDLLLPFVLTTMLVNNGTFSYKKIHTFFLIGVVVMFLLLMLLLVVQRVSATSILMGDDLTNLTPPKFTQYITQVFYALIPVMTTMGLTAVSISAHHYKVQVRKNFLKKLLIQLDDEELTIQGDSQKMLDESYHNDDQKQYMAVILDILSKGEILLKTSRTMLCEKLSDPQSTEYIMSDIPSIELLNSDRAILLDSTSQQYIKEEKVC